MSTPQLARLATEWPRVFAALCQTYYESSPWGITTTSGQNDAGYVLQGLDRYERAAMELHGHKGLTRQSLDLAAARETYYHSARGSTFRRPCAALSACWAALVTERPEKLYAARAKEGASASQAANRR